MKPPNASVEYLCDVGAAELLLPEDAFIADVQRQGFGLRSVMPLRERYAASREAIIRRMIQLDHAASAAVFLEQRLETRVL
jgi:Zn-dependent peptidase ImmA (M78 family)